MQFHLWIGTFRLLYGPLHTLDASVAPCSPFRGPMVFPVIMEGWHAPTHPLYLQISSHRPPHDPLHFLNALMIFMCLYGSYILSTVFDIELCAFFHEHICWQWSWQVTPFCSSLEWVSEAFKDALPQTSIMRYERYHILYCSSDSISRPAFLSNSTLYKSLHTCSKAFY